VKSSAADRRLGWPYSSGRSPDWLKMKNPEAPAMDREVGDELIV